MLLLYRNSLRENYVAEFARIRADRSIQIPEVLGLGFDGFDTGFALLNPVPQATQPKGYRNSIMGNFSNVPSLPDKGYYIGYTLLQEEITMKKFLIVFLVLLCTSVSAVAEQVTRADIQSLETKLTKIQETVTDMDKRLTALEITVTAMDEKLTTKITETEKRLGNQIAALDTFVKWAISVLVLVILAVIALPQVFGYLRDKQEREKLQKRVEQLEQEVAQLKTRMIAP